MTTKLQPVSAGASGKSASSFLIAQLLIVGVAVAGVTCRYQHLESAAVIVPPLLDTPREIAPEPFPESFEVLSEEQLRQALRTLRPTLNRKTRVAQLDHDLRFWGADAAFADVSGEQMRHVLLNHLAFGELYGADDADAKPLLMDVEETGGIRIRDRIRHNDGPLSSSHVDHTMACLSEVGTPLSHPVVTPKRRATYRQVVEQSFRDFSLNQVEYEWSALTYALHVKDVNHWTTSEGQTISFNMLARRIMRQEMPQGPCAGNHRLHTLTVMLRVDDMWEGPEPMLSPRMREEIIDYLAEMSIKLVRHQHPDGFWNSDWSTAKPTSKVPTQADGDQLYDRIIATGHALEWWALVPKQDRQRVLPPDPRVYRDAAQWLVRTIKDLPEARVREYSAFLSHAGRALALWRGKFPHQVDLSEPPADHEEEADAASQPESTDKAPGSPEPIDNGPIDAAPRDEDAAEEEPVGEESAEEPIES